MPKIILGKLSEICTCDTCSHHKCLHPLTREPLSGKLFTPGELKRHKSEIKKKLAANILLHDLHAHRSSIPTITPLLDDERAKSPSPLPLQKNTNNSKIDKYSQLAASELNHLTDATTSTLQTDKDAFIDRLTRWYEYNNHTITALCHSVDAGSLEFEALNPSASQSWKNNSPQLSNSLSNAAVLDYERFLNDSNMFLEAIVQDGHVQSRVRSLCCLVQQDIRKLETMKVREWQKRYQLSLIQSRVIDTRAFTTTLTNLKGRNPLVLNSDLVAAALLLFSNVSTRNVQWTQNGIRRALGLALKNSTDPELARMTEIVAEAPKALLKNLGLSPVSKTYVCCPICFELYPTSEITPTGDALTCQYRPTPSSNPCGADLYSPHHKSRKGLEFNTRGELDVSQNNTKLVPIKKYAVQDIGVWIGRLYSRPDIEALLETGPAFDDHHDMKDIWDGEILSKFLGPDGRHWLECPKGEGRLIFAFNYDGFNPYGNREAGKTVSVCGIYLVCLNLPRAIRFNIANICLFAVVPGPSEPSKDRINSVLRPMVDQFLPLWYEGIYLSSTNLYPVGRTVRAAVVPGIHDRVAADQVGGFEYKSNHHCNQCWSDLDTIDELDISKWRLRSLEEHRNFTEAWRTATNEDARASIYSQNHLKWSELLRLPYWDPIKHTTMDSMHAFSRLLNLHTRDIWGMNHEQNDGPGKSFSYPTTKVPDDKQLSEARNILRLGSDSALKKLPVNVLRQLCRESGLRFKLTQKRSVKVLLEYKKTMGWTPGPMRTPTPLTSKLKTPPTCDLRNKFETINRANLNRMSKKELMRMYIRCVPNHNCKTESDVEKAGLTVSMLQEQIQNQRLKEGVIDDEGHLVASRSISSNQGARSKKTSVLGKNRLELVRKEIKNLRVPSWMTPSPRNPGNPKWGKFSAAQWNTFGTVHLPSTLIAMWGTEDPSSREYKMLLNYLHLISAIEIATKRTINKTRCDQYTAHMSTYVQGLLELYPGTTLVPYHHRCLHFAVDLQRFGPSHSHRCFSFEFYNGRLQKFLTNSRLGELEITIFERFCMAQNLHAIFESKQIPDVMSDIIDEYQDFFGSEVQETFLKDNFTFEEELIGSSGKRESLTIMDVSHIKSWLIKNVKHGQKLAPLPVDGLFYKSLTRRGQAFQTSSLNTTNCQVAIRNLDFPDWHPGIIQRLFSCTLGAVNHMFAVVRTFASIAAQQDPLRSSTIAFFGARHFKPVLKNEVLIHTRDIIGHVVVSPGRHLPDIGEVLYIRPCARE